MLWVNHGDERGREGERKRGGRERDLGGNPGVKMGDLLSLPVCLAAWQYALLPEDGRSRAMGPSVLSFVVHNQLRLVQHAMRVFIFLLFYTCLPPLDAPHACPVSVTRAGTLKSGGN